MLEKPNIPDQEIIHALHQGYALTTAALTFLPIGADASAAVYAVTIVGGERFFLKLKRGLLNPPSYRVPWFLKENGIEEVVAPIPTKTGELWYSEADRPYSLILYPFIDARTGYAAKMTNDQWHALGAILKRVHTMPFVSQALGDIRQETFELHPKWGPIIEKINGIIEGVLPDEAALDDPFKRELAAFWQSKRAEIDQIVARTIALGQQCQQKAQRFVLCHADFHIFNVLVDNAGALFVVDWDETLLAPIERDLMFVVGQSAGLIKIEDEYQAAFLQGYGYAVGDIDPITIAYYRYEWVVQEIGDFGERVFFRDGFDGGFDGGFGEVTKADSVKGFKELFDPGDVVEGAYRSDMVGNRSTAA